MPANVIIVNGQEFIVPDSWMPVLLAYLQLMQSKIEQPNPNYGVQVEATQPEPFSLLSHPLIKPLGKKIAKEIGGKIGKVMNDHPVDDGDCDNNTTPQTRSE